MVDEKILAKVFRAAACGVIEPFNVDGWIVRGASYDNAKSMAGAFESGEAEHSNQGDVCGDCFDGCTDCGDDHE